jgi:enoyl-CoA hydratase/carnithine racemase
VSAGLVTASVVDGVGRLRLTNPAKRNAISHALVDEATVAMEEFVRRGVRVAVLEADAPIFCAGNDLAEVGTLTDAASTAVVRFLDAMLTQPLFWIGSVAGPALGGGMALVAACPVAIVSDQAWFSLPERRIGFFPSGVLPYLEVVMGTRPAFAAGLTGRRIPAAEAATMGLIDEVVPHDRLSIRTDEVAAELSAGVEVTDAGRKVWQQRFRTAGFVERQAQLDEVLREQGRASA